MFSNPSNKWLLRAHTPTAAGQTYVNTLLYMWVHTLGWGVTERLWLWKGTCFLRGKRFPQEYQYTAAKKRYRETRAREMRFCSGLRCFSLEISFWPTGKKNHEWISNILEWPQNLCRHLPENIRPSLRSKVRHLNKHISHEILSCPINLHWYAHIF